MFYILWNSNSSFILIYLFVYIAVSAFTCDEIISCWHTLSFHFQIQLRVFDSPFSCHQLLWIVAVFLLICRAWIFEICSFKVYNPRRLSDFRKQNRNSESLQSNVSFLLFFYLGLHSIFTLLSLNDNYESINPTGNQILLRRHSEGVTEQNVFYH